jgi:urease accessory protein UreF
MQPPRNCRQSRFGAVFCAANLPAARDPAKMWSFAPGLDVQGMLHARLDTRLFRS